MTLATRCPQCGTTFRVVSDQLKLRKGLVKCGKCLHVFNGIEFLHYFSEPVAPAANEPAAANAIGAPTPEFLGIDEAPVVTHASVPTSAPVAAEPIAPAAWTPPPEHTAVEATAAMTAAPTPSPSAADTEGDFAAPAVAHVQHEAVTSEFAAEAVDAAAAHTEPEFGRTTPTGATALEAVPDSTPHSTTDFATETTADDAAESTPESAPEDASAAPLGIAAENTGAIADRFVASVPTDAVHAAEHEHTATDAASGNDTAPVAAPAAPSVETSLTAASSATPATETPDAKAPARTPWYARLGHGATPAPTVVTDEAPKIEPVVEEEIEAAPAPASPRDAEIDAIAEMRERVARARQAAEADDGTATLSPLTLIDVARPSSETVEDRFEELPAFLRERRRAPAWLRVLIVLLAVLSLLALLGQAAYVYRAEIAAEFPALRSPLAAACAALPDGLRCELGLPRHITPLRVVSADLQPVDGGNFNLVVAIHNDDALPMAYPALDVILTDAHTQVLIRRVITADEYLGAHRDAADRRRVGLIGNAETNITVPMHIADEGVVGYTVGIFYP